MLFSIFLNTRIMLYSHFHLFLLRAGACVLLALTLLSVSSDAQPPQKNEHCHSYFKYFILYVFKII